MARVLATVTGKNVVFDGYQWAFLFLLLHFFSAVCTLIYRRFSVLRNIAQENRFHFYLYF